ncbi:MULTISPECIES: hypothetical protein [unclassified Myroides]|uniref:hypothetical protein n=1 Tax=unclassified Myroides TaxID=2642485 RepID=UPI003D2F7FF5
MAKIDKNGNLRGAIGSVTTRVSNNQNIIQQKCIHPKQTANTKKAAQAFGYASKYSKLIRFALCTIIGKNHDRELFRRFTSATYNALKNNVEIPSKERTFFNTNMQSLVGFDLNSHSPFADSCTLPIQVVTMNCNTVVLMLDSFTVQDHFVFPKNTTEVRLDFTLIPVLFPHPSSTESKTFSMHFSKNEVIDAQVWETPLLLPPYFTVMIAEVHYIQKVNMDKTRCINNSLFHPATIVYVHNGHIY